MAVTKAAQRRHDISELEDEIKKLRVEIVAGEFAERLASNSDFEEYGKFYRAALAERLSPLKEMEERLVSQAIAPADSTKLREQVMLLKRDSVNVEDFLTGPERMVKVLKDLRERLELAQQQLKKLKGGTHGR